MEQDAVPGVLWFNIDNQGGENGPWTFALAAGCADSGYSSVVVVLWSLKRPSPVSAFRTPHPNHI
jgi:hypothetical protein